MRRSIQLNRIFCKFISIMADAQRERRVISENDAKIVFETSEEVSVTPTFDSMKIREDLLRGIYAYGKRRIVSHNRIYMPTFSCSIEVAFYFC